MSVEEARAGVRAETVEAVSKGVMLPKWYESLDRLILEVRAEMRCYRDFGWGKYRGQMCWTDQRDLEERGYDISGFELCPSCAARKELDGTAPD